VILRDDPLVKRTRTGIDVPRDIITVTAASNVKTVSVKIRARMVRVIVDIAIAAQYEPIG
jgi:hypothetical protein